MVLPNIDCDLLKIIGTNKSKLLICSEGFETRSYYWVINQDNEMIFDSAIVCKYNPGKCNNYDKLLSEIKKRTKTDPKILEYNRFVPTIFEQILSSNKNYIHSFDEIYLDISVMSKLLLLMFIYSLKDYNGKLSIIYSEPKNWSPPEDVYRKAFSKRYEGNYIGLSSVGIFDVVRTPGLSSVVMQGSSVLLVAFLSFNEQLIKVLLNSLSPADAILFNIKCDRIAWREEALINIHKLIIDDYSWCNPIESNKLKRSYDIIDYIHVFEDIASIYRKSCYTKRIILAPTGSKLHAVSCALMKICCSDIHIEYPTPESYCWSGYSSDEILAVHSIQFDNFSGTMERVAEYYQLNG